MESNRFAPPKARVDGAPADVGDAPALWNPNAAANWSLLFTPIFGAWLHMLNWRELGETKRAESAKTWVLFCALMLVGLTIGDALMPDAVLDLVVWLAYPVLLLGWYFGSARAQARWVADRFDSRYPRKGWWQPLLGAVVLYVATSLAMSLIASVAARWMPR